MIALLKFLITGNWPCSHQWEEESRYRCSIERCDLVGGTGHPLHPLFKRTTTKYTSVECKCAKCGEIKTFNLQ